MKQVFPCLLVNVTYGTQAHPTRLHSHHNHHRCTEEGCTARCCICTLHHYKVRVWGFDLSEDKKKKIS